MAKKEITKINRIKVILAEKDMSQKELARLWDKTTIHVSYICNNARQPKVSDFPTLSKILGVPMNELVYPTQF